MSKPLLIVSIVLAGIVLGVFHYKLKPRPTEQELREYSEGTSSNTLWQDQIAPDFEIKTTEDETFRLSDAVGKKIIVLNFFATWCGPCRGEMPELNRYYHEHKDDGFVIVGIDSEEQHDRVSAFVKELEIEFPVAIDNGPIQKQYRVEAFPTTVLIGVDGKVQFYEAGALKNAEVAFEDLVAQNRQVMKSGKAISGEMYRQLAQKQTALPVREETRDSATPDAILNERAERIVARMDCPCGCEKKVARCTCHTSKNIKDALAREDFHDSTDDDIIKGLNKRFCSGAM